MSEKIKHKFFNNQKFRSKFLSMFKFKKPQLAIEEGIKLFSFGDKISKELDVFYNPVMKLNRDISLLVIATYFEKPIKFCDPMAASGIREMRFLKTIPKRFEKLVVGDISKTAIKNIKKNFRLNGISLKKVELKHQNALFTIAQDYYDFIEVDPFGSPVPFLDIAIQKIKHNGILSVTATDTAALCGTYPKTTLRKYNIRVSRTLWHEELGLRNLIAYCQIQAAKYEKLLVPIISYSQDHYYKIFFQVQESRTRALDNIKQLRYIEWETVSQESKIKEFETKDSMGKTYVGPLNNKDFIKKSIINTHLIKENKKIAKLLTSLYQELDIVGYYNPHKFQKHHKFESQLKFEEIIERLKSKNFKVSRPHNNKLGIKTNASAKEFMKILKK